MTHLRSLPNLGTQQSPVLLDPAFAVADLGIQVQWTRLTLTPKVARKFEAAGNGVLIMDGERYVPVDVHYHFPAEHALAGQTDGRFLTDHDVLRHMPEDCTQGRVDNRHKGEVHIVHVHEKDVPNAMFDFESKKLDWHKVVVLGVLLASGGDSEYELIKLNEASFETDGKPKPCPPKDEKDCKKASTEVEIGSLLPDKLEAIRYCGSLTTPPYSENVTFAILTTPVPVPEAQFGRNALTNSRCLESRNRRTLLRGDIVLAAPAGAVQP